MSKDIHTHIKALENHKVVILSDRDNQNVSMIWRTSLSKPEHTGFTSSKPPNQCAICNERRVCFNRTTKKTYHSAIPFAQISRNSK